MRLGRLDISGGALLVVALLYYLDNSGVIGWVLVSSLLHEMGHWLAVKRMGGEIRLLRLSCAGAELHLSAAKVLLPQQMVLAALAGPVVNLLLALGSMWLAGRGVGERLYLFAGINLGLACFNLLPVSWLDGGRALENLLIWLGLEKLGETIVDISSKVILLLLLIGGGLLLWQSEGKNFTLLIAGIWMLGTTLKKSTGNAWIEKR